MSNPHYKLSCRRVGPNNWILCDKDGMEDRMKMSENEAKYAAFAINQHETLIKALTRLSMCTPSRTDVIIARTLLDADAAMEKA